MSLQPCESENAFASELLSGGSQLVSEINSSTVKNIRSITNVPAGTYLVIGQVKYDANSTGYRSIGLTTTSESATFFANQNALSSGRTYIAASTFLTLSATSTIYLTGYQNSGDKLGIYDSTLRAYRLF